MKKIFYFLLLLPTFLSIFLFVGCSDKETIEQKPEYTTTKQINLYLNNDLYSTISFKNIEDIELPSNVVGYTGYSFVGWYYDNSFSEPFNLNNVLDKYKINANTNKSSINLYAKFEGTEIYIFENGEIKGLTQYGYTLQNLELNIPEFINGIEVTSISGFSNCDNIIGVTIPKTIKNIANKTFYKCYNIETINYNAIDAEYPVKWAEYSECFYETGKNTDGVIVNIGQEVINIPNYLFFVKPKEIEYGYYQTKYEFINSPNIIEININLDSQVETIGQLAFEGLNKLATINIPKTIEYLGSYCFGYCSGLKTINFYAQNYDCYRPFACSGDITGINVIIGSDVSEIKSNLFGFIDVNGRPPILNRITFEENSVCEKFGAEAFACIRTKSFSIDIPESLKIIGNSCFYNSSILYLNLRNVENIAVTAFQDSQLQKIIISRKLKNIGDYAFSGCSSLVIFCETEQPLFEWGSCWNMYEGSITSNSGRLFCQTYYIDEWVIDNNTGLPIKNNT